MSQRLLLARAALLGGLIFLVPARADEPKPGQPDKKQLDALQKEIEALRKQPTAKQPAAPDKTDFRIFRLKYVGATDMAKSLQSVFGGTNKTIRLIADPQTNSLLVVANDRDAAAIQALIRQLDVAIDKKKPADSTPAKSEFRIFALKNASATAVARTLKGCIGGPYPALRIVADKATNSVLVRGSAEDLAIIEAVLTGLDVPVAAKLKNTIRVYPLKDLNAGPTAKILRDIFPVEQYPTLRLSVSEQTNSLIVSATTADLVAIESLLLRLETLAKEKKSGEKR